jgi:hypothetical protein
MIVKGFTSEVDITESVGGIGDRKSLWPCCERSDKIALMGSEHMFG